MRLDDLVAESGLGAGGLLREVVGDPSTDVTAVTMDSRAVIPGALFACVPGRSSDGHLFAPDAVASGAVALLCEHDVDTPAPRIVVTSVRRALGPVSDAVYGHPSRDLVVAGVTGTNGKTTTVALLRAVFEANGWATTSVGTLTQSRTTPEAPELHSLLADWRRRGGRAVAMEVSSHALDQHRTGSVRFAAGVFTNLSPDHLDYHHDMDTYFEAKALLFQPGSVERAVINTGDPWGRRLAQRLSGSAPEVATFDPGEVENLRMDPRGSRFTWRGNHLSVGLAGRFNVANAVAAAACATALGIGADAVAAGLETVRGVPGRFQLVDAGQPFAVVVDYAHTPDGMAKVLESARQLTDGRLIVVFGAGGDRDRDKRPLMGAEAVTRADLAVVTTDNPRGEDPQSIIAEILAGTGGSSNIIVEPDRAAAIATALATAVAGDIVVIAGKGHERGQEIGGRVLPFDDVEEATIALGRIRASRRGTP